ncbi:hypothetical protein [Azospirillum halopraeferens]|uniref:hypothetical protein n=1 Tax=Azospirillum halopraeferens TaxID=34010 RepID=UPI000400D2FC|nr:hypothetical protein [Azospirillum halopraeferens]
MNGLLRRQTWHSRVAELLDDPVAEALLRRDGLSRDDVIRQLAPVAEALNRRRMHYRGPVFHGRPAGVMAPAAGNP